MHLHANVVRFERTPFQQSQPPPPTRPGKIAPSFVSAVKGILPTPVLSPPAMVLDDSCMVTRTSEIQYGRGCQAAATNSSIALVPPGGTSHLTRPILIVDELVAQKGSSLQPDVKSVGSNSHTCGEGANNVDDQFSTGREQRLEKVLGHGDQEPLVGILILMLLLVQSLAKTRQLAVKGVMIDGEWVDDPSKVKDEFRDYFASRFCDPGIRHGVINFNFPNRILNSSMASILVNGSPTKEFQFHRGLKQGDPLAPYLFIIIMESLHLSFSRVIESGIFTGIKIDSSTTLSHLFYADDAVFIGEWSRGNLTGIMHTLRCFALLSGLSINPKKSQLLGVGIPESQVLEAATLIGCSVLHTPFKYLGIMVGENMSSIRAWDETVNKLKMSLSS
ncbi:RNA-directed DNA polymerase, eukaryota [Tanacetum coccineum]